MSTTESSSSSIHNKANNNNAIANKNTNKKNNNTNIHVIFVHLDLGIGGAEQLVLQLATASDALGYDVSILTTRCDANHCFALVKPPKGKFCKNVHVWGRWIPAKVLWTVGQALCSHVRMMYLAVWLCLPWIGYLAQVKRHHDKHNANNNNKKQDYVVVVDVLPTPLLWLRALAPHVATLFYCHFPDQLLVRGMDLSHTIGLGERDNHSNNHVFVKPKKSFYRTIMDAMEEATMPLADVLVVNSKFTKSVVQTVFPTLHHQQHHNTGIINELHVLYPALDTDALDSKLLTTTTTKDEGGEHDNDHATTTNITATNSSDTIRSATSDDSIHHTRGGPVTIVSLNRYERKKNIELVLQAFALLQQDQHYDANAVQLIIAGGYDTHNAENVEYRAELERLAFDTLQLDRAQILFQVSISDAQRTTLLQRARCVVYTPSHEHFGIVPLEVMYAGTPVIACASGGPLETVVDQVTGYLCEPTPQACSKALAQVLNSPAKASAMGRAGRQHVVDKFGTDRLQKEWYALTQHAVQRGQQRQTLWKQFSLLNAVVYLVEAFLIWCVVVGVTMLSRRLGWLEPTESILGKVRQTVLGGRDEL